MTKVLSYGGEVLLVRPAFLPFFLLCGSGSIELLNTNPVSFTLKQCCGSGSSWIRNFCLDPDPELGKLKA